MAKKFEEKIVDKENLFCDTYKGEQKFAGVAQW